MQRLPAHEQIVGAHVTEPAGHVALQVCILRVLDASQNPAALVGLSCDVENLIGRSFGRHGVQPPREHPKFAVGIITHARDYPVTVIVATKQRASERRTQIKKHAAVGQREGGILASEDLTTLPLLGLHQDLAVATALGCAHVERNGQHYVRGLGFLSEREQRDALRHFPSLYRTLPDGTPALRIDAGTIATHEVNALGFGAPCEPDWEAREEIELPA